MPRHNQERVRMMFVKGQNALAGIPQIKDTMKNLYMIVRPYRFFNIAKPTEYNTKQHHEGITYGTVEEQSRATGQVGKSD